jgi:single-strand DNA-binding protein
MSFAGCTIVGRLTRDAELKYTSGGLPVCNFSLATSKKIKGEEKSYFWDCQLWNNAEKLNQYLTKGKLILATGTMEIDEWEKDGIKKSKVKITVNMVDFLSSGEKQVHVDANNPTPSKPAEFEDDSPIPF